MCLKAIALEQTVGTKGFRFCCEAALGMDGHCLPQHHLGS